MYFVPWHKQTQYYSPATSDEEAVYDRTVWASEKLSLQMALDSAEHEIQRLRGEIRSFKGVVTTEGIVCQVDANKVMIFNMCTVLLFLVQSASTNCMSCKYIQYGICWLHLFMKLKWIFYRNLFSIFIKISRYISNIDFS